MSQAALIVTHGSPSDPEAQERDLADLAAKVAVQLPDWTVSSATLAAGTRLEEQIEALGRPLVYPFFMAAGWFTQTVLPKRLDGFGVAAMTPFGVEPALLNVSATRVEKTLVEQGWNVRDTALIVAAHGSARSKQSANAARDFAAGMQAQFGFREVRTGFVEQDPRLEPTLEQAGQAICLPFFATNAGHMMEDVPDALAETKFAGVVFPAFIDWPETVDLIAQSLRAAV